MKHYLVGDVAYPESNSAAVEHGKPVAVIDPDDREQVERLHTLWCGAIVSKGTSSRQIDSMQAALREFANPTPPKCGASFSLAGLTYRCEGDSGHDDPHHNDVAKALWGERK